MPVIRVGLLGLGEVAQSIHLPVLSDQRDGWKMSGVYESPSLMAHCRSLPTAVAFASAEALIIRQIAMVPVSSRRHAQPNSSVSQSKLKSTFCSKSPLA